MADAALTAQKAGAARLSVFWNVFLVILKVGGAVVTGSVSVLSEAIHALTDLAAAGLVFFSVRRAEQPPDRRYPFGQGKWENVSGTLEAALIATASVAILWEATRRLVAGGEVQRLSWAMAVLLLASVVNWWLSAHLFEVAERTRSVALEADGHNLRVDVFTSLGVLAGLVLIQATGLMWIDSVAAIGVGLLNLRVAWGIYEGAAGPLLDAALPEEEVATVDRELRRDPRVLGYHKLRTRRSGPYRHIDVHLFVDDDLGLREAHDVAEKAEDRIREALPGVLILTHVEPWGEQTPQDRARFLRWREQP